VSTAHPDPRIDAYRRIYARPATDSWDGSWHLVIVPPAAIDESSRRELRKELEWDGFGVLGPGLFARPARPGDEVELSETTRALGIDRHVAVVTARALPRGAGSIAMLTGDCWGLKAVAAAYRGFVARFKALPAHSAMVPTRSRSNASSCARCSSTRSGA
jgi:phenylacetic acid degradation operon negative regulatory protein